MTTQAQFLGTTAVILFAHGSRDPLWRRPVEAVAQRVCELDPTLAVACAYLELSEPDLTTAADALIRGGARQLTVLPLFLGVGKHAREDLPVLLEQLASAHPDVTITVRPAVGEDPGLIDAMARLAIGKAAAGAAAPPQSIA